MVPNSENWGFFFTTRTKCRIKDVIEATIDCRRSCDAMKALTQTCDPVTKMFTNVINAFEMKRNTKPSINHRRRECGKTTLSWERILHYRNVIKYKVR